MLDPLDALHGQADDRERVLPALPARAPPARARARAADGAAPDRAARRSARSRSRRAPRRSRSCRRRDGARPARARSSAAAPRALRRYGWLYGLLAGGAVAALGGRRRARAVAAQPARRLPRGDLELATPRAASPTSSSTTSPSSTSTSASSRSRRCSLSGSRRAARRRAPRAFAAASLALSLLAAVEVAAFASASSVDRIEERNTFYLAPLALTALLGLAADGVVTAPPPRARRSPPPRRGRCRSSSPTRASSRRAPSPTHSRSCPGGGCRTTASSCRGALGGARRLARGRRALLLLPRRSPSSCRRSSPLLRRHDVRGRERRATASTSTRSARSGPASTWRIRDWIDRAVGRACRGRVLWTGDDASPTGLGERVLQPQRRQGLRPTAAPPDPLPEVARAGGPDGVLATGAAGAGAVRACPARSSVAGKLARAATLGVELYRVNGPIVVLTHVTGSTRDTWSAARHLSARRVHGGRAAVQLQSDPPLFTKRRPSSPAKAGASSARRRSRRLRDDADRAAAPGRAARCTVGSAWREAPAGAGRARLHRHRAARRPLPRLHLRAVRIAFDVSPLSHERTGVNNYIRGSLQGLAEAAQRAGDKVVAFAPTSPEGRRVIPEALEGIPVELRLKTLVGAHGWRTAWSRLGYPPAERWLGKFDVLHFTDWMYPPQRRGLRATTIHDLVPLHFPEWVTPRTRSMHLAQVPQRRPDLRRDLRELCLHGRRRRGDARLPARRVVVAHPGIGAAFTADGEAADLGVPYVLTVATLEPRKNLWTLVDAFALLDDTGLAAARRRRAGLGRAAAARPPRRRPARPRGRRRAGSRSIAAPPWSYTRRGSRGSGCRSSRRWRPARPSSPRRIRRSTRPAATRPCAPIPRARRRSPRGSARRSHAATSCARRSRARSDASRGREPASCSWRGTGDSRSDRHDAAQPDARGHGALRQRAARPPRRRGRAGRSRRRRVCAASSPMRSGTRGCADGADLLHCPTFRGPFSSRVAARRHGARPGRARPSELVQGLVAPLFELRRTARRPRGLPRDRRLGVHPRRADVAARRRRRRSGSCRTRSRTCSRRKALGPTATTCSPSARSSRARTSRGSPPPSRASFASSAPGAGVVWSHRRTSRGSARSTTPSSRPSTGRALPRLRLALRRLRHPRRRGARMRLPDRDQRGERDGGVRGRRCDLRRPARRRLDP